MIKSQKGNASVVGATKALDESSKRQSQKEFL